MSNLFQALVSSCLLLGLVATANAEPTASAAGLKRVDQGLSANRIWDHI